MQNFKTQLSLVSTVLATICLLLLSSVIGRQKNQDISGYFAYQGASLLLAAIVVAITWQLNGRKFSYFRWGNLKAANSPVKFLGIKSTDSWKTTGLVFAVMISAATLLFLLFAYGAKLSSIAFGTWVLATLLAIPLSAINAFNEEIITRWSVAEALTGTNLRLAPWVSALIFGSVHFYGIPGGFIGSLMAGFLGWFLTKSIQDTRGFGWAWVIHFVQDLMIFTITLAMLL